MSIDVTKRAVARSQSTGVTRLVLLCLCDHASDSTGLAWPAVSTIMKWANASERAVQKGLKSLCENGEIEVMKAGGGRNRPTLYLVSVGMRDTRTPQDKRGNPDGVSEINPAEKTPFKPETPQIVRVNPAECAPEPLKNHHSSSSSSAREAMSDDDLWSEIIAAVGLNNGTLPSYWLPPAATIHVGRWRSQLGLTAEQIIATARESRKRHDEPPRGPKALDRAMANLAGAIKADPVKPSEHRQPFSKKSNAPEPVYRQVAAKLKGNQR